uniref:Uncharacterized protein n=1 Tax=Lotus japonicus TaxID=34305 RepID=I3TAS7_LOTJA|nr:unknown [Lotus japonicus]
MNKKASRILSFFFRSSFFLVKTTINFFSLALKLSSASCHWKKLHTFLRCTLPSSESHKIF